MLAVACFVCAGLVNTPSAKADGFSDKLCGNPLAWRPTARSMRKGPLMHDDRRRHITVEDSAAFAAVRSLPQGFGFDPPAFRAGLGCASRIDQNDISTGTRSLVLDETDQLAPRGIVNGTGQHPTLEPGQVEILKGDCAVARNESARELMREVAPLVRDPGRSGGNAMLRLEPALRSTFAPCQGALSAALRLLGLAGEARMPKTAAAHSASWLNELPGKRCQGACI